jgi:hypothetical protein
MAADTRSTDCFAGASTISRLHLAMQAFRNLIPRGELVGVAALVFIGWIATRAGWQRAGGRGCEECSGEPYIRWSP